LAGNESVNALLEDRHQSPVLVAQRQGLTFAPEQITGNVTSLGPAVGGGTPDSYIGDRVTRLSTSLRSMQTSWLGGLDAFMAHGLFASSEEAQPKYGEAILKYAFNTIVKETVGKFGEKMGKDFPIVKVYEMTMGLIEELDKEHERIEKAEGQVEMKNFINEYRATVINSFNEKIAKAVGSKPALLRGYKEAIDKADPESQASKLAKPTASENDSIAVAGPAAEFLNSLETSTAAIDQAVPKMEACLAAISEAWVEKAFGKVASKGGGDVYINGQIYVSVDLHIDESGAAKVTPPTTAKLAAPQADKVADALMEAMKGTGGSINELGIQKVLTINVEKESGHWYSTNHRYRLGGTYADPDQPTHYADAIPVEGTDFDPAEAAQVSKLAYELAFRRDVLAVKKLEAY
jgi:hypothetical protein